MSTGIEKFKTEERIRRLFFKHRGNINAIINETGFDGNYIRAITKKIKGSLRKDVNFEIACFITDAILAGREQRLIIMEDRLQELLNKKKKLISACCNWEIKENKYENEIRYKCLKCFGDCDTIEIDTVNDTQVVKLIDRMRKEDELIAKFLATMGIVATGGELSPPPQQPSRISVESSEVASLPPVEKKMLEKLQDLNESEISEIRRFVEDKINEATNGKNKP